MIIQTQVPQKPVCPARRRWLAKRHCQRALRAMLTFMVLVTPFLYFGYILCCRMPFNISRPLPNWILLYEFYLLIRNTYVFFRYVWITPLWAALPLILNLYFIPYYPPGSPGSINETIYFESFKKERLEIIKMIDTGQISDNNTPSSVMHLPQPYTYLATQNGLTIYTTIGNQISAIFCLGRNILTLDIGLCYVPDDNLSRWLRTDRVHFYTKLEQNWYIIYPEFGYLHSIMNDPPDKETGDNAHPTQNE